MTDLKPFAIAAVISLVSGSTAYAADHRDGSILQDNDADLADTYSVSESNDSSFVGVELNLDADLTYFDETIDTKNLLDRK